MMGTLREFLLSLSLRAVSVKVGTWMRWDRRCPGDYLGERGVTSRWHTRPYPRAVTAPLEP